MTEQEFEQAIREYRPGWVALAEKKLNRLGVYADAEELVQDALLKLWESRHDAPLRDIWTGMCHRLIQDVINLRQKRRVRAAHDAELPILETNGDAERIELQHDIARVLADLWEPARTALALILLQEYTIPEAAEAIGVNRRTVIDWITKFRPLFRERLKDYFPERGEECSENSIAA